MNPQLKTKTSVGLETVDQTVARAKSLLSPKTGFNVQLPDTLPAEAINGDISRYDARVKRDQLEQTQLETNRFDTDFNNLMGRIQSPLTATPFQNPGLFIEQTLLRRPTETQTALDAQRQNQAEQLRDFSGQLDRTRERATEQFALPELQANLAETRNRIAERTTQLRQTLRDFEVNAERRGVARQFVESEKGKVQADAAAELADLAIIESAQAGNVQMAQADIDRAVNAKIQAFEFENAAIQAEIQRLEAMDTRESQARSEQLQIALQERNRNIEQAVADEKQKLTYLSEAAANGADQGTLDAIRRSTNPGEAALLAGPFIGRLDRQMQQANLANIYSQIGARDLDNLLKLAEAGDVNAAAKLGIALPDGSQPSTDVIAYAQQYAATGTIPPGLSSAGISFGAISALAKDLPKPKGTLVNVNTGVKDSSLGKAEQDDLVRLYNITQAVERLKTLDEQRIGGVVSGTLGKVFGSEAQTEYLAQRKAIVDEIARMQTGAALTEDEQAFYNDYLPGRFSESFFLGADSAKKIETFDTLMNQKLQNALANNQLSIYGYSKINLGGQDYTIGEQVVNEFGQVGIVNPDGTITLIQ